MVALVAGLLLIGSAYAFRRAWVSSRETMPSGMGMAMRTASAQGGPPVVRLVKNPQKLPAFSLHDLTGNSISSADLAGKVILLNFWATWCPALQRGNS